MQRLQVLAVVEKATRDLATVMASWDSKKQVISLEDAVKACCGSEVVSEDVASLIEARVEGSKKLVKAARPPPALDVLPIDSTALLFATLQSAGSSAAKLVPEDRLVAQRLLCVGLELLMCGGSVMPACLTDQLGGFAGIMEANAARRLKVEEMDDWQQMLSCPLQSVLAMLLRKGILISTQTEDGEVLNAAEDSQRALACLRRFFDPVETRAGVEDALRRATNRVQRLRPQFSFRTKAAVAGTDTMLTAGSISTRPSSRDVLTQCVLDVPLGLVQDGPAAANDWSRASTPSVGSSSKSSSSHSSWSLLPTISPMRSPSVGRSPMTFSRPNSRSSSLSASGFKLISGNVLDNSKLDSSIVGLASACL